MHYAKTLISVLSWGILLYSASADDWPQWQGPDRNAISKERGLLKEWTKDGPPLAWKIKGLGGGYTRISISAFPFAFSNRRRTSLRVARPFMNSRSVFTTSNVVWMGDSGNGTVP